MGGEVIAFSDLFDRAATYAAELGEIYSRRIPVQLFTDSKSLFDVISKGSRTSEKRLMLDIAAAREGFRNKTISDIGFVRSSSNIADGLTKAMSQAALQSVVSSHLDFCPPCFHFYYFNVCTSRISFTLNLVVALPPHFARLPAESLIAVFSSESTMILSFASTTTA
eukprot:IDg537t1